MDPVSIEQVRESRVSTVSTSHLEVAVTGEGKYAQRAEAHCLCDNLTVSNPDGSEPQLLPQKIDLYAIESCVVNTIIMNTSRARGSRSRHTQWIMSAMGLTMSDSSRGYGLQSRCKVHTFCMRSWKC